MPQPQQQPCPFKQAGISCRQAYNGNGRNHRQDATAIEKRRQCRFRTPVSRKKHREEICHRHPLQRHRQDTRSDNTQAHRFAHIHPHQRTRNNQDCRYERQPVQLERRGKHVPYVQSHTPTTSGMPSCQSIDHAGQNERHYGPPGHDCQIAEKIRMRYSRNQEGARRKRGTAVAKKSTAHNGASGPHRAGAQKIGYRHANDAHCSSRTESRPGETGNTAVQYKG